MAERRAFPQDHSLAFRVEGTGDANWGVSVPGAALIHPVEPGTWLNDNLAEFRDEGVRNIPVRDFDSQPVTAMGEGRIMGNFYAITSPYFLAAMMGRERALSSNKAFSLTGASGASGYFAHEFTVGYVPRPLTIQQSVTAAPIGADGNVVTTVGPAANQNSSIKQLFLGMLPSNYTLKYDAGEGAVTWETEMVGKGLVYPKVPKTEVFYTASALTGNRLTGITAGSGNEVPRAFLGTQVRVAVSQPNSQTLAAYGNVMDAEIMFSREIAMDYSSGGHAGGTSGRRPTILQVRPLRVTFTATVDLVSATPVNSDPASRDFTDATTFNQADLASIRSYSNPGTSPTSGNAETANAMAESLRHGDSEEDTHYGSKSEQRRWMFRFTTPQSITATSTPSPDAAFGTSTGGLGVAGGTDVAKALENTSYANTDNDAVMDLIFEKVSYGEAPVEIDRSGASTTFQFKCVATYNPEKGINDGTAKVRLYNKKNTTYFPGAATAANDDLIENRA